jgi:hypothetical protein
VYTVFWWGNVKERDHLEGPSLDWSIIVVTIIMCNEMGEACSTYEEIRGVYRVLVGRREGKRQFIRPKPRLDSNCCDYNHVQ